MSAQHIGARAIGIDIGTSGVRIAAVDAGGRVLTIGSRPFGGTAERDDPGAWWRALEDCFAQVSASMPLDEVDAIAVDGTSGTVLAVDATGQPVGRALMYDAICPDSAITARLDAAAPRHSPARGKHSALARAAYLARGAGVARIVHQADWIAMRLGDGRAVSDENNALKTGYDLQQRRWPDWLAEMELDSALLPEVVPAGTALASVGPRAVAFGIPKSAVVVSGTTDGCASFLATGAGQVGDGVTALGSTLVLKLLSDREINAPAYGIYSHRISGMWLAGGASNTGGAVIRSFFPDERLAELSARMAPERPTGLDYYPLPRPGERFPTNDPELKPRLTPRPDDDAIFFQAILEGIAGIEKQGYDKLSELGAPALRSVRSVGGGAINAGWTRIRQARLGVPFAEAASTEAAAGTAQLALRAVAE